MRVGNESCSYVAAVWMMFFYVYKQKLFSFVHRVKGRYQLLFFHIQTFAIVNVKFHSHLFNPQVNLLYYTLAL